MLQLDHKSQQQSFTPTFYSSLVANHWHISSRYKQAVLFRQIQESSRLPTLPPLQEWYPCPKPGFCEGTCPTALWPCDEPYSTWVLTAETAAHHEHLQGFCSHQPSAGWTPFQSAQHERVTTNTRQCVLLNSVCFCFTSCTPSAEWTLHTSLHNMAVTAVVHRAALHIWYAWFRSAQGLTGWKQLIAPAGWSLCQSA